MFSKRSNTTDAPGTSEPTEGSRGTGGAAEAPPAETPPEVQAGVTIVRYQSARDPKLPTKLQPVLRALVVKAEGSVCSLKVLGAEGGTSRVDGVQYSTKEKDKEPRWF
jgi:hypothetical protein